MPKELLSEGGWAGDLRIGDLDGDGQVDFLVFRSADEGMKPCFLGAFSLSGRVLWQDGSGGDQPARPGPVVIHDLDGDGGAEVVCFFVDPARKATAASLENVVIQVREGRSGRVLRQGVPEALRQAAGYRGEALVADSNWVHQRLLVANFRGTARPQDFLVKLGPTLLAFDDQLRTLWTYTIRWNEYGSCSAYIPAVGDIDGDGRDEVNGGYYLLDSRGRPRWEKQLAANMDSVAIAPWDGGKVRAFCSGGGHVVAADGRVVLRLGEKLVPHGQELRVVDFTSDRPGAEMVVRWNGHEPDAMLVGSEGRILRRFRLNPSPNNTGMEAVFWQGPDRPAALYNGGWLWHLEGEPRGVPLPGLPKPKGPAKMGWFHAIPADVCSDRREELVLYNPWDRFVWIYTPDPIRDGAFTSYKPGPRQYNARLMD